jgi:ectoine hydroxylase-related dioxygenase (phytanoyl-CoA dioxygenase family)
VQAVRQLQAVDDDDDDHQDGGFPWDHTRLSAPNHIAVHSRVLRAVSQLLGTEEIMLTQSGAGTKRGENGKEQPRLSSSRAGFGEVGDQPMHKDFGNNIVLVPGIDTDPEAVNCILYLSDVADCGGATAVVPHTPQLYDIDDEGRHVNFLGPHSRYSLPRGRGLPGELYATERLVRFRPGTALLYRQDTWHRGSCMVAGALRRTQHLVW